MKDFSLSECDATLTQRLGALEDEIGHVLSAFALFRSARGSCFEEAIDVNITPEYARRLLKEAVLSYTSEELCSMDFFIEAKNLIDREAFFQSPEDFASLDVETAMSILIAGLESILPDEYKEVYGEEQFIPFVTVEGILENRCCGFGISRW